MIGSRLSPGGEPKRPVVEWGGAGTLLWLDGPPVDWPKPECLVLTCARQPPAVRREGDGIDLGFMPLQSLLQLAGLHIPKAHLPVPPSRRHGPTVRREGDRALTALGTLQGNDYLPFLGTPDLDEFAAITGGDHPAVWRESNRIHVFVLRYNVLQRPRLGIPPLDLPGMVVLLTADDEHLAVRRKSHGPGLSLPELERPFQRA